MRILYVDVDSLRPDHLGCYGYGRDTSPTVDALADEGRRFTNVYASDVPCLPSRTALFSGRFGVHTGVVNHGGIAADPRPLGGNRTFRNDGPFRTLPTALREAGLYTATISPFPSRHAAFHVLDGFREWRDTGEDGLERADQVLPVATDWLQEHAAEDDWFLHVNFWDPHTPYDTPESYGNPFSADTAPAFPDKATVREHYESYGPHSAQDVHGWGQDPDLPRTPAEIDSRAAAIEWIDGYDVGVRYFDDHLSDLLAVLQEADVADETFVVVSADHGENLGELNVYGDHQTADEPICNVPLVMRGPGIEPGVDEAFHYQLDLAPTLVELAGGEVPERWDAKSFAKSVDGRESAGRDYVVTSQGAWACQRGVRWDDWLLLRTYHAGLKDLEDIELYNLATDPHETTDLSDDRPEVVDKGERRLETWIAERMREAAEGRNGGNPAGPRATRDPLWTVIEEGGPYHATEHDLDDYYVNERLPETDREALAEQLRQKYRL